MIEITDQTFEQEVLKSSIPVLVDFYATWCGPCKAAAPVLEKLSQKYAGQIKFCKLDIDTGGKYAMQFEVKGIPNFIVFKDGVSVKQFVGFTLGFEDKIVEFLELEILSA